MEIFLPSLGVSLELLKLEGLNWDASMLCEGFLPCDLVGTFCNSWFMFVCVSSLSIAMAVI